jgi:hypothetical protein
MYRSEVGRNNCESDVRSGVRKREILRERERCELRVDKENECANSGAIEDVGSRVG